MIRDKVRKLVPIGHLGCRTDQNVIYFRNNENPFGTEYKRYPGYSDDGMETLPEAYLAFIQMVDKLCGAQSQSLDNSNVLFTQGAAGGFEQIIKTFFEPAKDIIGLTPPYFSVYARIASIFNIDVREIPLTGNDMRFLDVDKICSLNIKGIVLCDPNNPVGSRLDRATVRALIERFTGLIIIDEAYVEYSQYASNLHFIQQHPNVLILRTASKALGMAGLRIGAILGRSELIEAISRVQLPFAISSCAAKYARATLEKKDLLLQRIARFKKERDRVYQALLQFPFFSQVSGEDSGFLAVQTEYLDDIILLLRHFRLEPVFRPERMRDWIRISIGTQQQNDRLIQALQCFDPAK